VADSEEAVTEQSFTPEDVQALREERAALLAKRDELLTEVRTSKTKLRAFEGIDPEEHRTLKQRLSDIETQEKAQKSGITGAELDKLKAEVRKQLEEEYTPYRANAEKYAAEIRGLRLDSVVKTEMARAGVKGDRIDALFRLTSSDYDLTEDGKPILKDNIGLEIGKYIREDVLKLYPEWFEGSGSSGGGASKSVAGGGGTRVIPAGDNAAFLANVENIASGKVTVR
jgi:hypothetical protein